MTIESGWADRLAQTTRLSVVIADDHPLMLSGVRRTLECDERITVVGEAHSTNELVGLVERRLPDAVLMDLRMPGMPGNACIEQLRERWPELTIVVLSACEDPAVIEGALAHGASSFVFKRVESADLAALVLQAARGAVYHAGPRPRPRPRRVGDLTTDCAGPELTNREQTILTAVAAGMTTAAISRELWVSEHTVKFHLTNIYRKLGVANRAAAIRYAMDHQLIAA